MSLSPDSHSNLHFPSLSTSQSTTPSHHLIECLRICPHKFKVSSIELQNAEGVALLYGKRNDLFLVLKEGDSRTLFVRGNNHSGELGNGRRRKIVKDLEEVFSVKNAEITMIRSGGRHSLLAVRKAKCDELYACGYNSYSQCAIPTMEARDENWLDNEDSDTEDENEFIETWTKCEWPPKNFVQRECSTSTSQQEEEASQEESIDHDQWRIKLMDCGACHTIVVTQQNRIFVRGYNEFGQCGLGVTTPSIMEWREVVSLKGEEIRHVVAECFSTYILTASNNLYTCGFNSKGCGIGGQRTDCILVPTRITYPFPGAITHLDAGEDHILVVTEDRNLYGCGANRRFESGFSDNYNRFEFEKVECETLKEIDKIEAISCGVNNSLLLTNDGKIRPFGDFFASLTDNEYISLDEGYVRFITMLDDRFVFIRTTEPPEHDLKEDWHEVKRELTASAKKFVTTAVEASIPTPMDFLRRGHFSSSSQESGQLASSYDESPAAVVKKTPRKRRRESNMNEEVQVRLKKKPNTQRDA